MNKLNIFLAYESLCAEYNLPKNKIDETIDYVSDIISTDNVYDLETIVCDESIELFPEIKQRLSDILGEEQVNEVRMMKAKIATTGISAKKREAKSVIMKELKKNKTFMSAVERAKAIANREAKKIAREHGISPNLVDVSTIRI